MRKYEPQIRMSRLCSRLAILTDEPYETVDKIMKAALILLAQSRNKDILLLVSKYKKFQGTVPLKLKKVRE